MDNRMHTYTLEMSIQTSWPLLAIIPALGLSAYLFWTFRWSNWSNMEKTEA